MITVKEKNGFIYIKGYDEELDWCDIVEDSHPMEQYFLLNCVTKWLFKEEFLELIKHNQLDITQELYDKIRTFKQNPDDRTCDMTDIEIRDIVPGIVLMPHQIKALGYMLTHNKYAFFYGPGTGKTLIAIAWLLVNKPNSCLIVTPQKVIGQYKKELDKYIPGNNYEVTNYEMLHKIVSIEYSGKKRTYKTEVFKKYQVLIIDESHRAKSYTSEANIRIRTLAQYAESIYLFTGTPQDKNRHDILSQLAILDPRVMPSKTKTFQRYFRIDDYHNPKHEIRERKSELTEVIKRYAIAEKTENVIELKDAHNYIIKCPHPTTSKLYDILESQRVLEPEELNETEYECVCDTPTLLRTSLKELCCGLLTIKHILTQEVHWIRTENTKLKVLYKLLENIPKAIIYYEFTESIEDIKKVIDYRNKTYVVVNGLISANKSTKLITEFKNGNVDYLIIQSKSGNAGLDLSNVNNVIFYSLPDSFIIYKQCMHRIRRQGQLEDCNYYYLIVEDSVEEDNYDALQQKKSFNDRIFKQLLKEK